MSATGTIGPTAPIPKWFVRQTATLSAADRATHILRCGTGAEDEFYYWTTQADSRTKEGRAHIRAVRDELAKAGVFVDA